MFKNVAIAFVIVVFAVISFAAIIFAQAQQERVCGDGIVQSPNDEDPPKYERCDGGEGCTAECGAELIGWGWTDNGGWVSLSDDSCLPQYLDPNLPADICGPQNVDYFVQADALNQISGWAWSQNLGWICFGQTCATLTGYGDDVPPGGWHATVEPGVVPSGVKGWAKILALGDRGWLSLTCDNDDPPCEFPVEYEVELLEGNFNGSIRLTLAHTSWNNNVDGNGVGTVWFHPEITEIPPWLQTLYGDIYARGGILAEQAPPSFNATYRILSGGLIEQFVSKQGTLPPWLSPDFGPIDFPTPNTRFSNVLGSLDIPGLTCNGTPPCINRFGNLVVLIEDQSDIIIPFANRVYYRAGDLTLTSAAKFFNASGQASGAGTVVVDGDLIVENDLTYCRGDDFTAHPNCVQAGTFKNLASVAWIVRGDLRIAPSVNELAGNFIVLGNGTACDSVSEQSGCGQVYSCSNPVSAAECQRRLTVSGMMMARKFYLERTFPENIGDSSIPTELIIYDGRLLANTPPGLSDFARSLPIWRPGTFSQ